jgi:hypothetical protein
MSVKRFFRFLVFPIAVILWAIGWAMYSTADNGLKQKGNAELQRQWKNKEQRKAKTAKMLAPQTHEQAHLVKPVSRTRTRLEHARSQCSER